MEKDLLKETQILLLSMTSEELDEALAYLRSLAHRTDAQKEEMEVVAS